MLLDTKMTQFLSPLYALFEEIGLQNKLLSTVVFSGKTCKKLFIFHFQPKSIFNLKLGIFKSKT